MGLRLDSRTPGAGGLSPWIWDADRLFGGSSLPRPGEGQRGAAAPASGGWGGSFGGALPGARLGSPPPPPGPQASALRQGQQWRCPGLVLHTATSRGWGPGSGGEKERDREREGQRAAVSDQRGAPRPLPQPVGTPPPRRLLKARPPGTVTLELALRSCLAYHALLHLGTLVWLLSAPTGHCHGGEHTCDEAGDPWPSLGLSGMSPCQKESLSPSYVPNLLLHPIPFPHPISPTFGRSQNSPVSHPLGTIAQL